MNEQIGAISAEKLLGMEIDLFTKLRSGAITETHLKRFLNKQNPFFRTLYVRVGNFGSIDALKKKYDENDYGNQTWFFDELSGLLSPVEELIEIVMVTPEDLGFTSAVEDPREFFQIATSKRFGFRPCPVEVAFQLLFIDNCQRTNEWLHIAAEPLVFMGTNNMLMVNSAQQTIDSWYLGHEGRGPGNFISLDDVWVFRMPKESEV